MSNKNFTHMPLGNPPVTLMLECVGVQGFTIPWNLVDRELVFSVPKFEYKTEDPYLPPLIGMNMTAGVLEKCRDSIAFVNCEAVESATSRLLKHPYSLRTDDDPIIRRMCDYHLAEAYCVKIITPTFAVYVYLDGSCVVVRVAIVSTLASAIRPTFARLRWRCYSQRSPNIIVGG